MPPQSLSPFVPIVTHHMACLMGSWERQSGKFWWKADSPSAPRGQPGGHRVPGGAQDKEFEASTWKLTLEEKIPIAVQAWQFRLMNSHNPEMLCWCQVCCRWVWDP
uniref:Uncharacterized protein n=1 Tax=Taeniopygia guttata TaxID=59729 RepID=A0A674H9P3_TAEGU